MSKGLRTNEQIRISPIRLIDDQNNQIGVIETHEAMRMAREAGMDLVEVAPNDRPPVCRIMDYGKWKYRQKKKEQKARQHHHSQTLKEVRLRPKTDTHDREYKLNHAREFLEEGDKVQFTMLFRGREMAHQDLGMRTMMGLAESLAEMAKIEQAPKMAGRRMTMVLMPVKKQESKPKKTAGESPAAVQPSGTQPSPAAGPPV